MYDKSFRGAADAVTRRGVSRRGFLAGAGIAGIAAGALALGPANWLAKATAGTINNGDTVPILIIGSGYGGSVAALRLAQAGKKVAMVEMGQSWTTPGPDGKVFCNMIKPDDRSYWFKSKTEAPINHFLGFPTSTSISPPSAGILDAEDFANMRVYQGRGVGGGSLVNGGMSPVPNQTYFQEQFPSIDPTSMYSTWYPKAYAGLKVNNIDQNWFATADCYKYTRVSQTTANNAGYSTVFVPNVYDFNYMKQEQAGTVPRSALASEVIYGNNYGKQDLTKTYLAAASATGNLSISPLHQVTTVKPASGSGYTVVMNQINTAGTIVATKTVTAAKVIFAAGSVGTSKLLVSNLAQGNLPNLPASVGTGWGNNGNVMAARAGLQLTGMIESSIPTMGINAWDNTSASVFAEISPVPIENQKAGFDTNINLYLACTKISNRASFTYNSSTNSCDLSWSASDSQAMIPPAKTVFDAINKKAGTVYRSDLFGLNQIWGNNFCYHPLGGCLLNVSTDNYGRLNSYPGLYVMDGSLIPGSLGVNPFTTITALAERNIDQILTKDSF